jgi:PAS domain S-box-containing protein
MLEFLRHLFSSDFMGHGYCYLWKPDIVWLHVISDALITLAYYSIPVTLLYFVRKRRDLPFHWMFLMFGAFILGCGTTHAMEIWTIWHGTYRLAGVIKLITAGLSVGTAAVLVPLVPKALALPSPMRLARANEEIRLLNENLERRVSERTAALEASNQELQREIAERKRADDRFRLAVESAPNAMIMVSREGAIAMVNSQTEKVFGYSRSELLGQPVDILVPEEFRGVHPAHRDGFFGNPQARAMGAGRELFGLHKDGSRFPVEIGLNPIETDQGTWVLSTIVDISGRKRAEEERKKLETQMQHAQKLESLGVLAGGIAHDFNNLLVGVVGNAGLALMELSPESPARETVKSIETTALRTAELTKQLLAYSGKGKFAIQPVNLSALVEEMTHLLKFSISKKANLCTRLAGNLPAVDADVSQIRQVVMNLITNASEALGDQPGEIAISTSVVVADRAYLAETFLDENLVEGSYVALDVADSGVGMDEETKSKIFDPFFTTKFTGRGLGLAAVLGITRGHGGAIKVYSEPGRGTTFRVLLPSSEKAATMAEAREPSLDWQASGSVLVIDDDETVREVARRILERAGFTVLSASGGHSGVEMFRSRGDEIRAVLLDMTMPDISGEEVFRALRKIRPDVKVILSSGYNEQETVTAFQGKGLAGFIQKPYQPAELVRALREILK